MNQIKWPLLFFAIASAACMMGIGIAISFRSFLGIAAAIVALIVVMGFGFKTKKKMREQGLL
ncbi:YlaF family protein [Bacillus sp. 31A1R]|uniref:YlaF family protein n=1 Tax=Robertmurraya mangrovi TaxID=3098077 RepID=A0ABU5IU25_9BACI|nr:YlaF family protein [Bacillus sp. 31A1R]MDZ5470638.1 YlaF family protein [Bacillus sp. 31A1R]